MSKDFMKGHHSNVWLPTLPSWQVSAEFNNSTPCSSHFSKLGSKVIIPCGLVKSITDSLIISKEGEYDSDGVSLELPKAMPVATPF